MTDLLASNLRALATRNQPLAELVAAAPAGARVGVRVARKGQLVPVLETPERSIALHSLVDPVSEGIRLKAAISPVSSRGANAESFGRRSYLLFQGLGGGFQVRPFLESDELVRGVIVETDISLLKSLLSVVDLADILSDSRISLLLDPSPNQLFSYLKADYLPGIMGGFLSLPLRPRLQAATTFYEGVREAARRAIDATANDHTVQSSFGRTWMRNITANLPLLGRQSPPLPKIDEAIVAAAGPSLEEGIPELKRLRTNRYLIAADTSLPCLLAAGITPDAVLTIDCQMISYRHFVHGLPEATTLFLELAAPPALSRIASAIVPVAGGHPLSLLAADFIGGMPKVDTSGGNVGHAAVSLALSLGAKRVHLFGADFAYPRGKAYARESHLYDYFREHETRTAPVEGGFCALLFRNTTLVREGSGDTLRYTTSTLTAYRDRFEQAFSPYADRIRVDRGPGLPIRLDSSASFTSDLPDHACDPSNADTPLRVKAFIRDYRESLKKMPDLLPDRDTGARQHGRPFTQWELFATLYPLIAHIARASTKQLSMKALFADARGIALSFLERIVL